MNVWLNQCIKVFMRICVKMFESMNVCEEMNVCLYVNKNVYVFVSVCVHFMCVSVFAYADVSVRAYVSGEPEIFPWT